MGPAWDVLDLATFRARFGCDVEALPGNMAVVGRDGEGAPWAVAESPQVHPEVSARRLGHLLRFVDRRLAGRLPGRLWTLATMADGWRERRGFSDGYVWVEPTADKLGDEWWGAPGELPRLSHERPGVVCFAAHRCDPSAVLVPEGHYLADGYRHLFLRTRLSDRPWARKQPTAVFASTDHGDIMNVPGHVAPTSRRHLAEVVRRDHLDVTVALDRPVSRRAQLQSKYLIDIDGFTHTWDAFAWKMVSRSVVLAVESLWDTFFSTQFEPWTHYIPVRRDLSDLGERLAWCHDHDDDCRAVAEAGRARAHAVYAWEAAAERAAAALNPHLT